MIPESRMGYGSKAPIYSDYIIEQFLCKVNRFCAFLYKTYKAFYHFQQYAGSTVISAAQKSFILKRSTAVPVCTQATAAGTDSGIYTFQMNIKRSMSRITYILIIYQGQKKVNRFKQFSEY